MNDLITLFEDRKTKLTLSNEQINDILMLKETIWGNQNLSIQADGTLLMQHYVGYIVKNNTKMQILPKIYSDNGNIDNYDEEINEAAHLLFKLLAYSGYINIKEIPEPQKISGYNHDILEIFIAIFINRFLDLFTSDPFRKYEYVQQNMIFIKGKILFQESIKKNAFRKHMHYVEYEEFTHNTNLNKIFKTIILKLLNKSKSKENIKKLKLGLVYLEGVDTIRLSSTLFDSIRFNRLNLKYEPIFKLAKLFYHNYQPGFKEGDENTFSFLVPLNTLFEYFIYKLMKDANMVIGEQACLVEYQKPQEYLAKYNNKGAFILKPDITIMQKNKIIIILDAKYKNPLYQNEVSISQADVYQMLAYGVHYNCKLIYLVYPVFKGNRNDTEIAEYNIKIADGIITIKVVQIDIIDRDIERIKEQMLKLFSDDRITQYLLNQRGSSYV